MPLCYSFEISNLLSYNNSRGDLMIENINDLLSILSLSGLIGGIAFGSIDHLLHKRLRKKRTLAGKFYREW